MQPRRQPSFDPDDEWRPQPLADGRLDPPRRDPPTAVGTATPPPPSRPYRPTRYGRGLTRLERIARICFGGVLAVGGGLAVAITPVGAPMVAGAGAERVRGIGHVPRDSGAQRVSPVPGSAWTSSATARDWRRRFQAHGIRRTLNPNSLDA